VREMKELHYFSTVHMEEDTGTIKDVLTQESVKIFGTKKWQKHLDEVRKSWDEIHDYVIDLMSNGVDPSKSRIYQDGVPNSDDALSYFEKGGIKNTLSGDEILLNIFIKPAAEKGSKNYQIVKELIQKGVVLEGRDSLELLTKELEYVLSIRNAKTKGEALKYAALYKDAKKKMTKERDSYIAEQINKSLLEGYVGLAFFGAGHSIVDKLDKCIDVTLVEKFKDTISLQLIALAKGDYQSFTDIV